ncbi:MAG: hypothetical protein WCG25_07405 [bacterium]
MLDWKAILILAILALVVLIAYMLYIRAKKDESKYVIFGFLLFMQERYNEALWQEITQKDNTKNIDADIVTAVNNELRNKTEKRFQDLLQTLYCFSDEYSSFYYEPHTNNIIKELCPKLRSAFLTYKSKRQSLDQVTKLFFEETYNLILNRQN